MAETIITDKTEALAAVKSAGEALYSASDELKADKELVMAAVEQDYQGHNLEHASDELKADKEVVMVAVKDLPYTLQFASDELQNDPEILDGLDN